MTPSPNDTPSLLRLALPGIVVFLLVQLALTAFVWYTGFGEFSGPDAYMRLARVLECKGGLSCAGGLMARSNVPYGEVLHWPFLFDWILLLLASPLLPFLDFRTAVVVAGYLAGPLLGVTAVILLTAVARRLLDDRAARWAPVLASVHYWVLYAFSPVRPDHHGLQTLLFLLGALGVVRVLLPVQDRRGAWIGGAGIGLAVWASTEGLVSAAPLLGALTIAWIFLGEDRLSTDSARLWWTVVATLGLGLVLDGPEPNRWAVEFDRFSIVHLSAFALGATFWSSVRNRTPESVYGRVALVLGGFLVGGAVLELAFPGILRGPFSAVEPELWPLFLDHLSEFEPAQRRGLDVWGLISLVPGIIAVLTAGALWGLSRRKGPWISVIADTGAGVGWACITAALLWFLAFSLLDKVRWAYYLHALAPIGLAALLLLGLEMVNRLAGFPLIRAGAKTGLVLLFMTWPVFFLAFPVGVVGQPRKGIACPPEPLISQFSMQQESHERRLRVLAPLFWGPELIFRGDVDVVAGPYHRNSSGILDSYRVMAATDPTEARKVLEKRGIDLVVMCVTEDWMPKVPADSIGTLYRALSEGQGPSWLQPVPLSEVPERYRAFRVVDDP